MNREEQIAELDAWALEPPIAVTVRGKVWHVRELTTLEMGRRIKSNRDEWQTEDLALATGATLVICDDQGNLTMDPHNRDDVERFGRAQWKRINKIVSAIETDEEDKEPGN